MCRLECGQDDKREGVVLWTCLNTPAIPMAVSAGEAGNERAPTRLCVTLGCGEGPCVWFGRDTLEIVGLDVVQERLASAHVEGGVGVFG